VRDPTTFAVIAQIFICDKCVANFAESLRQAEPEGSTDAVGRRHKLVIAFPGRPIRSRWWRFLQTVSCPRTLIIRVVASRTICRSSSVNSAARYSTIQAILGRSWIIHGVSRSPGARRECGSWASRLPQVGHLGVGVVMEPSMVLASTPVHREDGRGLPCDALPVGLPVRRVRADGRRRWYPPAGGLGRTGRAHQGRTLAPGPRRWWAPAWDGLGRSRTGHG
jgi:hypothetical protein